MPIQKNEKHQHQKQHNTIRQQNDNLRTSICNIHDKRFPPHRMFRTATLKEEMGTAHEQNSQEERSQ